MVEQPKSTDTQTGGSHMLRPASWPAWCDTGRAGARHQCATANSHRDLVGLGPVGAWLAREMHECGTAQLNPTQA